MLMKKPIIQPIHINLAKTDRHMNLGGTSFRILNSHMGTSTKNKLTRLKAQLLTIMTLRTAMAKYGRYSYRNC